jgi:Uma2 family endonuclease
MSARPLLPPIISPEDYLEADRASEFRNEYYNGRMYAMAGGTPVHGLIIGNMTALLWNAVRGRGCLLFPTEVRVRVSHQGLYTFPDIMLVCGELKYADDKNDTIVNPTLLVEVLSPSTETHDRVFKFREYGKLESLQEYVLVEQKQPRVERFQRHAKGHWSLSEYEGLEAEAHFESVGARIRLADIYENVSFPPSQEDNPSPGRA